VINVEFAVTQVVNGLSLSDWNGVTNADVIWSTTVADVLNTKSTSTGITIATTGVTVSSVVDTSTSNAKSSVTIAYKVLFSDTPSRSKYDYLALKSTILDACSSGLFTATLNKVANAASSLRHRRRQLTNALAGASSSSASISPAVEIASTHAPTATPTENPILSTASPTAAPSEKMSFGAGIGIGVAIGVIFTSICVGGAHMWFSRKTSTTTSSSLFENKVAPAPLAPPPPFTYVSVQSPQVTASASNFVKY